MKKNLEYFEYIANQKDKWRKRNRYYWQDIEIFSNYIIPVHASVLEIGCGTGDLLANIKNQKKMGIDFSPKMIEISKRKYPSISFHVMNAENITLEEKFDYIIISNTIGYLDDIQKVFAQLHNVSHSHTKIFITYYNFLWQPLFPFAKWVGLRMPQPEQNWLSRADIKNILYLAGFETYKEGERVIFPYYIPILSNLLNRYLAKLPLIRKLCLTEYVLAEPIPKNDGFDYKNKYTVSVIVPARNESGNIENAILHTPKMGSFTEIIFIEGNSTDNTWEEIQKVANKYKDTHNIRIAQQDGKGKGDAVRKGFDMALGDILMILDADLTVPPIDLPKFYDAIALGKGQFINGSRLVYNMDKKCMRV